jgi:hypothetical protein
MRSDPPNGMETMTSPRRTVLSLSAIFAIAVTASCASSNDASASPGVIEGVMLASGGAPPYGGFKSPGPYPQPDIPIIVTSHGKAIGTTKIASDGTFRFTLRPGTYVVANDTHCGGSVTVKIKSSETAKVKLLCVAQ